jgi:YidC/Oxa1 family membrane protein insertase
VKSLSRQRRFKPSSSNRGARIVHWRLKRYAGEDGEPVDLVPSGVPADQPRPFALRVDDAAVTKRLNETLYGVQGDTSGRVDAANAPATLAFEFQDASGLKVRKPFSFEPDGYVGNSPPMSQPATVRLTRRLRGARASAISAHAPAADRFSTGNYVQPPQAILHRDGSTERIAIGSLAEKGQPSGTFKFIGIDDHYFLAAALPTVQTQAAFYVARAERCRQHAASARRHDAALCGFTEGCVLLHRPKAVRHTSRRRSGAYPRHQLRFLCLAGPAAPERVEVDLRLHRQLRVCDHHPDDPDQSGDVPLRHKTVVSMRKMQALQPQLKAIQDRYAGLKVTDPARQKMNTEVMNLYKERGVNPASGCVPMLLTMPVLFAFYSLLSQVIELRGAPFMGWIHDLSAHDPYYVTPLLMGASMFWQQKITPSTADPAQQRMMMFMPIVSPHVPRGSRVPGDLLLHQQPLDDRPAVLHELADRAGCRSECAAARGASIKNAGTGRTADADRGN